MPKHLPLLLNIALLLIGYFIGQLSQEKDPSPPIHRALKEIREISVVQLLERQGDSLALDISGPVRITWNQSMIEGDGKYQVPLGQIPNENDLKFEQFPYVGNAKTLKFYPSNSQFARGTHYENRRFFASKKEAMDAGFIPSKLVK